MDDIDDWKRARAVLIFKSGDRQQCANYRPISILPAVSKVFEKVFRQVYGYLTENCMLSKLQSAFRPKHSTVTPLIQMCDEWLEKMDKKAFDSINHGILLNKVKKHFGISCIEIESSNAVLIEQLSSNKTITCDDPQAQSWVHCCSYIIYY